MEKWKSPEQWNKAGCGGVGRFRIRLRRKARTLGGDNDGGFGVEWRGVEWDVVVECSGGVEAGQERARVVAGGEGEEGEGEGRDTVRQGEERACV